MKNGCVLTVMIRVNGDVANKVHDSTNGCGWVGVDKSVIRMSVLLRRCRRVVDVSLIRCWRAGVLIGLLRC